MDLTELRGLAYEAAIVPERWPVFLDKAAEAAGALGGTLFTISHPAEYNIHSAALDPIWRDFIEDGWVPRNPRPARALAWGEPSFVHDDLLFTAEEKRREAWYTVFCARWNLGGSLGTIIQLPSGGNLLLTLERHAAKGAYDQSHIDGFNSIRADLGRAMVLASEALFRQYDTMTGILEALSLAGAVVSGDRRILSANSRFVALMPKLVEDRREGMQLASPAADRLLQAALERYRSTPEASTVATFPVRWGEAGALAGIVHVVPVRGLAHDIIHGGAAIVLLSTPRADLMPSYELVRELFDLTPAESRVASQLVRQLGRHDAVATELGISRETERSHSKAVYQKLGIGSATELIALMARLQVPSHNGR